MTQIRANSVLPAVREDIQLHTADGLTLVADLALPIDREPLATIVCVHPLTTEGGSMQSHLLRKMNWRLPALAGLAVFRYNQRGAGIGTHRSEGEFDAGVSEGLDLAAALSYCAKRELPNLWLVGWSFGTDVILKHGARTPVAGAVLISPPFRFANSDDLANWSRYGRPVTLVVPEFDDYLRPDAAQEVFGELPNFDLVVGQQGKHLWVGEQQASFVLNQTVKAIAPIAYPLPTEWAGPMTNWSDL